MWFTSSAWIHLFVLSGILAFSVGCTVSDRIEIEDAEGAVPAHFFNSIKKRKTHKSWLIENLGPPQGYERGNLGEEVYSYHFKRTRYRRTSLLFILRYQEAESEERHFHAVICNDIVRASWWDENEHVQFEQLKKYDRCRAPTILEETKHVSIKNEKHVLRSKEASMMAGDSDPLERPNTELKEKHLPAKMQKANPKGFQAWWKTLSGRFKKSKKTSDEAEARPKVTMSSELSAPLEPAEKTMGAHPMRERADERVKAKEGDMTKIEENNKGGSEKLEPPVNGVTTKTLKAGQ